MTRAVHIGVAFGLLAVGCGGIAVSDRVEVLDGSSGTPDAAVDAMLPVHATVVARDAAGHPAVGADVLVSAGDGSVFSTARTNTDGKAALLVPRDGSVSLLLEAPVGTPDVPAVNRSIYSAYGIQEGQTILYLLSVLDDSGSSGASMTLNLSASGPAGVSRWYFSVPCWSARLQTDAKLQIRGFVGCTGKSTFDAYVFALDAADAVVAYGALLDQPWDAGGSRDLSLDARSTTIAQQRINVAPIVELGASLSVFMLGYRPGDFASSSNNGLRFETHIEPPGPSEDVVLPWPSGRFSDYKFGARVQADASGLRTVASFDRFVDAPPARFDFDPSALARVEGLDWTSSDAAHPGVTWRLADVGRLGDAIKISAGWSAADGSTSWSIAAPASRSGAIRLPDFSAALSAFAPPRASSRGALAARHFDDLGRDGYADYLATRVIDDASNIDSFSAAR